MLNKIMRKWAFVFLFHMMLVGSFWPVDVAAIEWGFEINVAQYIIWIMEALEEQEVNDATKDVKIKGADKMQDSQGTPSNPYATEMGNQAISATTIAASAQAMNNLLKMVQIDMDLISTEFTKQKEEKINAGVSASAAKSGSGVGTVGATTTVAQQTSLSTQEEQEIKHRRSLLVGEWATAAAQIGAGSNAISKEFNKRASGFVAAANAADGSLGGISAIADTDRFVLFEITRSAALSCISLGLQGAVNLNGMSDIVVKDEQNSFNAGVSAATAKTN